MMMMNRLVVKVIRNLVSKLKHRVKKTIIEILIIVVDSGYNNLIILSYNYHTNKIL